MGRGLGAGGGPQKKLSAVRRIKQVGPQNSVNGARAAAMARSMTGAAISHPR